MVDNNYYRVNADYYRVNKPVRQICELLIL